MAVMIFAAIILLGFLALCLLSGVIGSLVGEELHGPVQKAYPAIRDEEWRLSGGARWYDRAEGRRP